MWIAQGALQEHTDEQVLSPAPRGSFLGKSCLGSMLAIWGHWWVSIRGEDKAGLYQARLGLGPGAALPKTVLGQVGAPGWIEMLLLRALLLPGELPCPFLGY